MKKLFLTAFVAIAALGASAQNIQVHYDFGKHLYNDKQHTRQDVTLTYETFKADNLGSWYYFIDADIDRDGVLGAYTEVSREFNISKCGWAAHLEYDGGLNRGGSFQSAALAGIAWNGHNADFSTTYSLQAMYKQFFGQRGATHGYASFQLTGVWGHTFANKKLTFAGFFDLWRGELSGGERNGHGCLVFLTEPQLWYNISPKVSIGTEVEISNNFIFYPTAAQGYYTNDKWFVNPTLAVKFNL